jgi:hypothetical protein
MHSKMGMPALPASPVASLLAATPAVAKGPVTIVPNLLDFSQSGDAVFFPNGLRLAILYSKYRVSGISLWDIVSAELLEQVFQLALGPPRRAYPAGKIARLRPLQMRPYPCNLSSPAT